jgi:hypothetical protein
VALERLNRKFNVNVDVEDVRVRYRETITGSAEAEGKHKKQSGGHGQFAVCNIRIAPLARGEGFQFIDQIVGGAIPRQFIPAVQKGLEETMASGGVYGYPVVDVAVTLFDGKFHTVDSSEAAFKTAARIALREAMAKAQPVLLEPISRLTITTPADRQGDVLADLRHDEAHRTLGRRRCRRSCARWSRHPRCSAMPSTPLLTGGRGRSRPPFALRRGAAERGREGATLVNECQDRHRSISRLSFHTAPR